MEQAFIGADFTQAYVSCALGVHNVGYVMICFGVVNAMCSLLFGSVMKYIGRVPIMALGAGVHAALVAWLLLWAPHPDNPAIFFIVSSLWGVGDAVWQTQVNGEFLTNCVKFIAVHKYFLFQNVFNYFQLKSILGTCTTSTFTNTICLFFFVLSRPRRD